MHEVRVFRKIQNIKGRISSKNEVVDEMGVPEASKIILLYSLFYNAWERQGGGG